MAGFGDRLEAMVNAGALPFGGVGAIIAVLMILALRFLLPPQDLKRIQIPFILLVAHLVFVALTIVLPEASVAHRFCALAALLLILITLGRVGFLLLVDLVAARRITRPIPKIFRDIMQALVYSAAVLITLRAAGAQLDALLTTSALLTAVVGLSLQDTLGNLFAGLSIQAQRPFEVGDWIQFDDREDWIGHVVEINWRATKVLTLDDVEVVIPNGLLARAPIKNFSKPTPVSRRSVYVVVPREHPPHVVRAALVRGVRELAGVLDEPATSVVTYEFTERGVMYWVRFHIDDFEAREGIDGRVRDRVWYALRRAGIELAVPTHDVDVRHDDEKERQRKQLMANQRRLRALRGVDFCRALSGEQLERLALATEERPYAPGEVVVREGDAGAEFFIVIRGDLTVTIEEEAGAGVEVARLSSGSFFGEMSVMTGEPRTATVRAATDTWLLVAGKAAFQQILEDAPELAERFSQVLAARQEELSSAGSKPAAPVVNPEANSDRSGQLLERIREFFSL
ncbi:MAG: mechanosensitive ion channel family protein [Nannocystaceae bacterium]|nr:mechanosensitive ion channel family protein [Nannocystaceae bacterium]